ncbi:MAG: ABC transporter ATP-binding protein [Alphaproteobacteria bacterium]|nr:ABC transporter ATP-binding protein [Alphaproteobacteria bacterium]
MTAPESAISLQDLRKTYTGGKKSKPKEALKGIDLEVPRGAFFGLLGPNGAGKSTLINILAGLTRKTSGHASIFGHDIDTATRQARLSIGVVPQELIVDTFFTVREALDIHAGYYGVPKHKRRTQEIIDALGLSEQADIGARRLSGGMRRRLLSGKALVHNPPVLILDEPTAGVDVELRTHLWNYVRELNASGTTVLLTTHYLEEAQELCDRIAIINRGQVVACDRKSVLMRRLDHKRITLKLESPVTEIPQELSGFDGTCVNEEGHLIVQYKASEANVSAIFERARAAGLSIRDVATEEADLEDVFRTLTR